MVFVIIGKPELTEEQEKKSKVEKRIIDRVKRLRSLGHGIHHISSGSDFFHVALMIFMQQDLALIKLPHEDPLVVKL